MSIDATTQPDATASDTAPAKSVGRPTKLTPEMADALCQARQNGHSITGAADLCGVHRATLLRWLAEGEADDAPEVFRDFRDRFTRAHAHVIGSLVNAAIQDALGGSVVKKVERELPDGSVIREEQVTPPNGKVALEVASRLNPDWRGVKAVELSGPDGGPVEVAHEVEILEGLVSRVEAVKARKAAEAVSRCDDVA
ncbi:helix-turn-helix domain-containing protein [Planomonospora sp. ID82291]|uniref:helix-turn-helix domain-containing protein n=1 Tax=Planomonospora sp. ID82291 TaxID=2738136 RepID=UPI0018C3FF5B|nr:helix-turn-helix domain-containing protein [Planomonospora sp. ID82291]MBG0818274.1 Hin recombinase [Planomonospora sp. ID82291]